MPIHKKQKGILKSIINSNFKPINGIISCWNISDKFYILSKKGVDINFYEKDS